MEYLAIYAIIGLVWTVFSLSVTPKEDIMKHKFGVRILGSTVYCILWPITFGMALFKGFKEYNAKRHERTVSPRKETLREDVQGGHRGGLGAGNGKGGITYH